MTGRRTYPQAYNGDPVVVDARRNELFLACCDCHLVHRIQFEVKRGKVVMRSWRDNRKTAAIRRHRGVPIAEGGKDE